jgi:hypothetical protein
MIFRLDYVEFLNCLGCIMANEARCTRESIAVAKAAFNKNTLCTSELDFILGKKLVKCNICSIAL